MDVDVLAPPAAPKSPALTNGKLASSPADSIPPASALTLSPTSSSSASAIAGLLSTALAQVDSLKESLKKEKRRADHFENLASDYKNLFGGAAVPRNGEIEVEGEKKDGEEKTDPSIDDSRPAPLKDVASQLANAAEQIKLLRELLSTAEQARDEEMARRIVIIDLWAQLNQYTDRLEAVGKDARAGFDRIVKSGGGVMRESASSMFRDIPQLAEGELMRIDRTYNANGVLQPLASYSNRSSRGDYPREERHGTRRPRSGSMDAHAYSFGPNNKRVRYQDEHLHHQSASAVSPTYYPNPPHLQPPPPPGGANRTLSPTSHIQQHQNAIMQSMPFAQGQSHPVPLATASSTSGSGSRHRRHVDPAAIHPSDHHLYAVSYEHPYRSQEHSREYRDERRRRRRSRSYSHGRSHSQGSEASMDLDDMLLATAGDEQHLQPNGNGVPGQVIASRRKERPLSSHGGAMVYDIREGSQFVHQVPPNNVSPPQQHLTAHHSSHHLGPPPPPQYAQSSSGPPSGRLSPSFNSTSRPNSSRRGREQPRAEPTLREDIGDRRDGRVPDGSSSYIPNGPPGQVQYQTHVFAPVQTGAPVKKSKFNNTGGNGSSANVEESHSNSPAPNPAPVAPANSISTLPLASVNLAPTTSPFPPTNEQGQRICRQCGMPGRYKEGKCVEKWGPGPMGPGTVCDRCRKKMKRVERRGTIEQAQLLAAQQAQNRTQANIGNSSFSGSFSAPQREGSTTKLGRTDTVLVDSSGRHFDDSAISSIRSTSNARVVASSSLSKPKKSGSRPASKAASRAGSIVDGSKGSRRSSPLVSSRTAAAAASRNHNSNASVHSTGSGSGMDVDADADGDADGDLEDAEAEVEGDIAALVDQTASSPPRPRSGSRHKDEDDVDIAALAGVDDDPDDYDSPATTNALRRQQVSRIAGAPSYGTIPSKVAVDGASRSSADGDAELDILEAVDAAEANSAASSSGLKAEDP